VKRCTKCGLEKPFEDFYKNKGRKDGLNAWCKSCFNNATKLKRSGAYEYDPKHKEYITLSIDGIKRCTKCKSIKPFDQYYKDKSRFDGFDSKCKTCRDEGNIVYFERNIEKIKEYREDYRIKHRGADKIRHRNYYLNNREDKLSKNKKYREEHKTEYLEYIKQYDLSPKGRMSRARRYHNRRDRLKMTGKGNLNYSEWDLCIKECGNKCPMCGKYFCEDLKPTVDHIYPVYMGGSLSYWNVQPLCSKCNSSKGRSIRPDHEIRKAQTIANRLAFILNIST